MNESTDTQVKETQMSNALTTRRSLKTDPLADALAGITAFIIGVAILKKIFEKPEPKRTISGHSDADFARIIEYLERQS